MIVDRYDPMDLFEMVPTLKLETEPELAGLDILLDDPEKPPGSWRLWATQT